MRWIKASERLPDLGKEVIWKWSNLSGSYVELADWVKDLHGNPCIRTDNLIDLSDPDNQYYWLDEAPIDWKEIESKFHAKYMEGVYNSYYMSTEAITEWFKNKLNGEV